MRKVAIGKGTIGYNVVVPSADKAVETARPEVRDPWYRSSARNSRSEVWS